MALSQPRAETKVDDAAAAGIQRDLTQEEFMRSDGQGGQSEDREQQGQSDDREEPLQHWRTGSVPREFQGRSTASFIHRLVRAACTPATLRICCFHATSCSIIKYACYTLCPMCHLNVKLMLMLSVT